MQQRLCSTCGSPSSGVAAYCAVCGSSMTGSMAASSAGGYCARCGSAVQGAYCATCGAPIAPLVAQMGDMPIPIAAHRAGASGAEPATVASIIVAGLGAVLVIMGAYQPWYFEADPSSADRWFPIALAITTVCLIATDLVPELRWSRWAIAPAFGVISIASTIMWDIWWGWESFDLVERGLYMSLFGGVVLLGAAIAAHLAPVGRKDAPST